MGVKTTLTFKTGESLTGTIEAQAIVILIFKVGKHYYLINKLSILDDGLEGKIIHGKEDVRENEDLITEI